MEKLYPDTVLDLPFDQFQRYRALNEFAELVHAEFGPLKILDVGGYLRGSGQEDRIPAAEFLPNDHITIVDVKFEGPGRYAVASGLHLPFADESFDIVAAMDTLEHIPPSDREQFCHEMCRVAGKGFFLAGPVFDPQTVLAERILDKVIQRIFHMQHPMLSEHLSYGLPPTADIDGWLSDTGFSWVQYADGYLPNWLFFMILKHYLMSMDNPDPVQKELDRFYNLTVGRADRREPAYRRIYAGVRDGASVDLKPLQEQGTVEDAAVGEQYGRQMADLLMMLETARLNERIAEFFERNPSWADLMDLAEERHRIILHKDDTITKQLDFIRERDEYIGLMKGSIIEVEERNRDLHQHNQSLNEALADHHRTIETLQESLDRIHRTLPYRIYRFFRYGRRS
jgi:Methyltransferase domain